MPGFESYSYRGKPISDIKKWCKDRGERLVKYRASRNVPNIFSGKIDKEEKFGEMPESFWNTLWMGDGWHYEEIKDAKDT